MGLLRVFPIVILILQLFGVRGENLPQLPRNKLLQGSARYVPANPLATKCSVKEPSTLIFKNSGTFNPSQVLTESIFKTVPINSAVLPGAMERVENGKLVGGVGKFAFTKMEHKSGILGIGTTLTVYALNVQPTGEYAYWLPQKGYVDIPRTPTDAHPKYVFTADFSGCSWTVTPLNNGMLRLRHVNGNNEYLEFNNLTLKDIGGSRSYAMQYKDYGYIEMKSQRFENTMAYAYMHFYNGDWSLFVQQKTCAPLLGNLNFRNGKLETMKMNYENKDQYNLISGRKVFRIPRE